MKKIILLLCMSVAMCSCTLLDLVSNKKRNEEFEYFAFNERNKTIVNKSDIYTTKLSKIDSLNTALYEVRTRFAKDAKHIGSWDFSSKPSDSLMKEIDNKAIDLGANYIILFEKKDCEHIDLARATVTGLSGSNCYIILYYYLPQEKLDNRNNLSSDTSKDSEEENTEKSSEDETTRSSSKPTVIKYKKH